MKKLAILLSLTLTAASAGAMANNVGHANLPFTNTFTLSITSNSIPATVTANGNSGGGISNWGTPQCQGTTGPTTCTFAISSNGGWGSGWVDYIIGDATKQGAYCEVQIANGALSPNPASMATIACHGAKMGPLTQPDPANQPKAYTVSIYPA